MVHQLSVAPNLLAACELLAVHERLVVYALLGTAMRGVLGASYGAERLATASEFIRTIFCSTYDASLIHLILKTLNNFTAPFSHPEKRCVALHGGGE